MTAASPFRASARHATPVDPYGFARLLMDGALERIEAAREHLVNGEQPEKRFLLQAAVVIISELRADLDLPRGGVFAANLDDLYDYMCRRLGACLSNDRRSEGDPDRAAFCDRFPRIAGAYVRETIAESCRSGAAAVGEHCSDRLPAGDLQNGIAALDEVSYLLDALQSAWTYLPVTGTLSSGQKSRLLPADPDPSVGALAESGIDFQPMN